jgi:hypothetical protein
VEQETELRVAAAMRVARGMEAFVINWDMVFITS